MSREERLAKERKAEVVAPKFVRQVGKDISEVGCLFSVSA
jgi:hypothetical protein